MSESKQSVKGYRWVILILSYLCMLVFAFSLQSLPPILTLIIKELRLTHTGAGLLMSLFALPAIFLAILAGSLADRWGPYRVGIISLVLVIAGTLVFAISDRFLFACFARVVAGIGAATIAIVAAQILSQWFRVREIGTAMGIYNTAMPVGSIICFTVFGKLGEELGWRMPIFITTIIGVLGLVAFLSLYKPAPGLPKETAPEHKRTRSGLFSDLLKVGWPMWLIGFCWMWFNASVISFSTFAPDFFVSKGYSIGFAGLLVSILMWGSLGLSPLIGRLIDKINNSDIFIGTGGIILAISIYMIPHAARFLFPMIVMTVAVSLVPSPVYSFPSKILKPENFGLGFGILTTVSSIGMFFGPFAAGFVRDKTGSYEASFIFLSIIALLIPFTALFLRIRKNRNMAR